MRRKVIGGLKKMFENHMKQQHGPDWWIKPHPGRPEIETYIRAHCPAEFRPFIKVDRTETDGDQP